MSGTTPDRDKLIELIGEVLLWEEVTIDNVCKQVADHLISHGVTFATDNNDGSKWIPVSERLPEQFELVDIFNKTRDEVNIGYLTKHNEWVGASISDEVTHWKPRPEKPKEERDHEN